jgi:DNA-binding SARP family transcriptional activator/tetratricopeptide (TPR) repeat protein
MWVTLLGPVRARLSGPGSADPHGADSELDLGTPAQRVVLAVLAACAGRPVGVEELVDVLWGERAPVSAVNLVHRYVGSLRRLLEPGLPARTAGRVLASGPGGYRLALGDDELDLLRFRRLRTQADRLAAGAHPDQALPPLIEALGLWRGPCAAGLTERARAWPAFAAIDAEHDDAVCLAADVAVKIDQADVVLATVRRVAARDPLHEPLQARLVRTLASAGRQAEALAAYQAVRSRLADELGVDPGPELRAAQRDVLRQRLPVRPTDPTRPSDPDLRADPDPPPRPAQLPADLPSFSGRATELGRALDLIAEGRPPSTAVVCTVDGTAGVGKTTLAVHWAHQVAERFPDGQLYVNLRGFDPTSSALDPADVLVSFLDALGVPANRVPSGLAAQSALYRSTLAGRAVLVVLDNARDAEQVRPLLPGTSGCLTIVTSRNRLAGLVAGEGAHPLTLDLLPAAEARRLLADRLGADRLSADAAAVAEIVARCAGLPLALAIVATRTAAHPGFALAAIAAELRDAQGGLEAFAGARAAIDTRAVFSWSYRALTPPAALLFRALGLHPGPDLAAPAAASLVAVTVVAARALLAELTEAHLISEAAPGRYALHDLLRGYAAELGVGVDPSADRLAARYRLLDHYLHSADAADRQLEPVRDRITLDPARPGVVALRIADRAQALAWFAAEHAALRAAVSHAADTGLDAHAWQLTWAMQQYFSWRVSWHEWISTQQLALDAVLRSTNLEGQAYTRCGLGRAYTRLGRDGQARVEYQRGLDLYVELGDRVGQARTHLNLGAAVHRLGDPDTSLDHARGAQDLYRSIGDRVNEARALNNVGYAQAARGEHRLALECCQQALTIHQEIDDRHGMANAWDSLGYIHHRLAEHDRAVVCFQKALEEFRALGDRNLEGDTLLHLGEAHRDAGDDPAARAAWGLALAIFEDLEHPAAARARALLGGSRVGGTE